MTDDQSFPGLTSGGAIKIGVGAVVFRERQALLIKRGKPPFLGAWSIPGGGLHFGERLADAALREVAEETGVSARLCGEIGVFEALPHLADDNHGGHVVMVDYWGEWLSGDPVAGDDAAEAAFFDIDDAFARLSWDETRRALEIAIQKRDAR